jgi:CHAT domain
MPGKAQLVAMFWVLRDLARAELINQRWDDAIPILERMLSEVAENEDYFRANRLSLEYRRAVAALAFAYACTGRYDNAWNALEEVAVHDLTDNRPPPIDHRDAEFEGAGSLLSLLGLAPERIARPEVPVREKPFKDDRADVGLLRVLLRPGMLMLLLRTTDGYGRTVTTGLRHDVDSDQISSAISTYANTTTGSVLNYLHSGEFGIDDTDLARERMERKFAKVAPLLREPLERLLDGRRLRAIGISDDGGFSQLPFEAVPMPAPADFRQLLGDKYDVFYFPSAASGLRYRNWTRKPRHRVLFVASDDPKLNTQRDIDKMREFTQLELTVMHAADCTKREILTELSNDYSLVHFACHGRFDPFEPRRSVLLIGAKGQDERLAAEGKVQRDPGDQRYQVTTEDLDEVYMPGNPVVNLFACSSAKASSSVAFGFAGFPGAFFRAGASAVIGSRWSASNDVCFALMSSMYSAINQGTGPAAAFFAARRELKAGREPMVFDQGMFCYLGTPSEEIQ